MKKLNYRQINSVMGKELSPIQRKFMNRHAAANADPEVNPQIKRIKRKNKLEPFTHGNKPNNNDLCPCRSNRKFKHCCKITTS